MAWVESFLADGPLIVIGLILLALMLAARELGGLVHRALSRGADDAEHSSSDKGYILSGVLGLLALLIAFTFGLALTRYETRRELVVSEANAIGTAYVRVQLLDEPDRGHLSELLRHYAHTRLAYGLADGSRRASLTQASQVERRTIASTAEDALRPLRATPLGSLVISAINDVIDTGADREAALGARVPAHVLLVLLIYVITSAAMLGYTLAGARGRHRMASAILFLLFTLAITTILDLDRARGGTILVTQDPMADLIGDLR